MTLIAYKFALDPTPAQERALRSHAGAARVAFNWGLARVKANLAQREAERSYGITGDSLTPTTSWSLYSLRKDWTPPRTRPPRSGRSARRKRSIPTSISSRGH